MNLKIQVATAVISLSASLAHASEYMTEQDAHQHAVQILIGEPYGRSVTEVAQNIKLSSLIVAGNSNCGNAPVESAVWSFQIVVSPRRHDDAEIAGFLDIDAISGELVCATLPFLS